MPSASTMLVFAGAALVLCAIPGPAVIYIVTRGVESGRRAALASVLGIHVGTCVHITAAVVGLSALLMSSAAAFSVVKYVGAAYLIALGVQRLARGSRMELDGADAPGERELGPVFRQAIVVESLNPKTALFFLAFLPQFVDPSRAVAPQIAVLGLVWLVVGLCSDACWGLLAGGLGGALRRSARFPWIERFAAGGALIGLGVAAAFTGRRSVHAR
jgi:threonine/homoserine/homoserine lactone efflux protein